MRQQRQTELMKLNALRKQNNGHEMTLEQQKEMADRDGKIEAAGQNPGTPPEKFEELCRDRDAMVRDMRPWNPKMAAVEI